MARKRRTMIDGVRGWTRGMRAAWGRAGGRGRGTALLMRRQVSGLFVLALVSMAAVVSVLSCQSSGSGPRLPEALGGGDTSRPVVTAGKEPDIRVRIKTRVPTIAVTSPSAVAVRAVSTGSGSQIFRAPITVTVSPRGLMTADSLGVTREWGPTVDVELQAATGDADRTPMVVDGVSYPGKLTLRGRWKESSQFFDVVSTLPIEIYVAGVLQKELYDGWPRQSYEAQAIAARSYAVHERDRARRSGRQYDVESSTLDQAYGGMPTRVAAVEAARTTRGMMLTASAGGGGVLRAYYSSCCGGRPASASAIWPTTNGFEFNLARPLQGEPRAYACERAPVFTWEVVRKNDELVRRIRAWGRETGKRVGTMDRIRSIEPAGRNDAGRPNAYTVTDVKGQTFRFSAEEMRVACNKGEPAGMANGSAGMGGSPPPLADIRTGPTLVKSNDLEFTIVPPAGTGTTGPGVSGGVPLAGGGGDIRIRGRGFGHGVGLCQYCAKGFAERGQDAVTMLRAFYPGADVRKQY